MKIAEFNIVKGETYNNAIQGKFKILEIGKIGVRVLFYEGYKGKPQKVTITINELYRLCNDEFN